MKLPSTELFDLIKSMTASEISEYKRMSSAMTKGSESSYLKLFNQYVETFNPDESIIKEKLKFANFKRIKIYLHQSLIQFLSNLDNKEPEKEVLNQISSANFLLSRNLLQQALNTLLKAREKCIKYEMFSYQLIIDEKIYFIHFELYTDNYFDFYINNYNEEYALIIKKMYLEQAMRVTLLQRRIFNRQVGIMFRAPDNISRLEDFSLPVINKNEDTYSSFKSLNGYYITSGYYFQLTGEFEKATESFEKASVLCEKFDPDPFGNSYYYSTSLHNLLFNYSYVKNYVLMRNTLDKMILLKPNNLFQKKFIERSYFVFESEYCKQVYDPLMNKKRLVSIENYMNQKHDFNHLQSIVRLPFNLSIAYFCAGDFKKALNCITIMEEKFDLQFFKPLIGILKIYTLILYYEMNKLDLLPYALKNTHRYLLKNSIYLKFDRIIIEHLKKLVSGQNDNERKKIFQSTLDKLLIIKLDPSEHSVFLTFNFIGWLNCKIHKRSLSELMVNH